MSEHISASLRALQTGETATLIALRGGRVFQHRIVSMGLSIGSEIEIIRNHPDHSSAGSIIVRSGETRLMLGHGMSENIIVRRHCTGEPI